MTTSTPLPDAVRRTRRRRALDSGLARVLKLPEGASDYTVTADLRIPTRDGAVLLADHLAPVGRARGTVLVRGPYGFDALGSALYGGLLARYGYHVVLARVRGTFGSGGTFEPFAREVDDAADTVAWLREQAFFGGTFATFGGSYLGFTQWALLMDPPPELATSVLQAAPHDLSRVVYAGGALNLDTFLAWSDQVVRQESTTLMASLLTAGRTARRLQSAQSTLPVARAAEVLTQEEAPWFSEWATHRDLSDPYWTPTRLGRALDEVDVPVLLQTGWHDLFLQETLHQYEHLRARGVDVGLTIGPWNHQSMASKGYSTVIRETLDWLAEHLEGTGATSRPSPVRIQVTGTDEWRDLPAWPPAAGQHVLHPQPAGGLGPEPAVGPALAAFDYDPLDATPTVGGRLLGPRGSGPTDDSRLADRSDVLSFTGQPLSAPLEVLGTPVVELEHHSDNPHAHLFIRVSEVDARGRSRNISDGFVRLTRDDDGIVRVELDDVAHRFAQGSRLRLLIAGGCFPRFERDLGAGEDPAHATAAARTRHVVDLSGTRLLLPVPSS